MLPLYFAATALSAAYLFAATPTHVPSEPRLIPESGALSLVYPGAQKKNELGGGQTVRSSGESFRVESHGGTRLTLFLSGPNKANPLIRVEGPLPSYGDNTPVGHGKVIAQSLMDRPGHAILDLALPQPGLYRVIVGSAESLVDGKAGESGVFSLESLCRANCFRPTVDFSDALHEIGGEKQKEIFDHLENEIRNNLVDPDLVRISVKQLRAIRAAGNRGELDHGLILPPLPKWGEFQELLGTAASAPTDPPPKVEANFIPFLEAQKLDRSALPPLVLKEPVEIRSGHFDDSAIPAQQYKHSNGLAELLNSLATNNGSVVRVEDPVAKQSSEIRTAPELFEFLRKTGHHIELKQERVFANFLAYGINGKDLKWPVWIDTGVKLSNGETLKIPAGHTQYSWRVTGPLVNAEVSFYQGTKGTGFFPKLEARPEWSRGVVTETIRSGEGQDDRILKALEVAARYKRRIDLESRTVAKGALAQGYAETGVCNNSTAIIQMAISPDSDLPLPYPLLRDPSLSKRSEPYKEDERFNDHLDEAFARLPFDGTKSPSNKKKLICRILAMNAIPPNAPWGDEEPFASLRAQLRLAEKDAKGTCRRASPEGERRLPETHR